MRRYWVVCAAIAITAMLALSKGWSAGNAQEPEATDRAATAPSALDPSFAPVADVAGLPRVLIIGDSISMGYTIPVRQLLAGKANVHRPPANCGDTARGLKNLDKWLGDGKWDVIHFNFGLHDLKYLDANGKYVDPSRGKQVALPDQYEKNLRELVRRLRKTGAKLIWASTTPVPAGTVGRVQGDEVVYNQVAAKVMTDEGIPIDDLCAVVMADQGDYQRAKNVHMTPTGYEKLAEAVVGSVEMVLNSATTAPANP
jgi:lysophospholipase L1-like esterase